MVHFKNWMHWIRIGVIGNRGTRTSPSAENGIGANGEQLHGKTVVQALVSVHGIASGVLTDGRPFLTPSGFEQLFGEKNIEAPTIVANMFDGPIVVLVISDLAEQVRKLSAESLTEMLTCEDLAEFALVQTCQAPLNQLPDEWRLFHERVTLVHNYVPIGHFTVPKELADLAVILARRGASVSGSSAAILEADQLWWEHWDAEWLAERFPPRLRYAMTYPAYLPHAATAIQSPHSFPVEALEAFRCWIKTSGIDERLGLDLTCINRPGWHWPMSVSQVAAPSRIITNRA